MNDMTPVKKTAPKDWETDQEVRWCPGCGDYAILKAVQRTMPEIGATPENTVFVSGIGCSSRFPYYMETYGFHTIHGRAPAVATGVKLANPDLDVWIVSGDGDALSIGGNHTMHLLRRNLDCQFLLFNNEIYGLTKGQYSPTSREGTRSPSTPFGSVDRPATPCAFALGSGARFVARTYDVAKQTVDVLKAAHAHKGAAFVEIFQNCIVYNADVFAGFTEKANQHQQLWLENGKPMLFAGGTKGIAMDMKALTLKTWVADSTLLTAGAVGEPIFSGQQSTTAWFAILTDQYGQPRTMNCDGTSPMTLQARAISGPSDANVANTAWPPGASAPASRSA